MYSFTTNIYTPQSYTCKHRKLVKQRCSVFSLLGKSKCFSYCAGGFLRFTPNWKQNAVRVLFLTGVQGEVKVLYRRYSPVVCERLE